MQDFLVATDLYTIVTWLSVSIFLLGLVAMIVGCLTIGWYVGIKSRDNKKIKLWFAFGWIPILGIFFGSIFLASTIYDNARADLAVNIKARSDVTVITYIRGNEKVFIGNKDNKLVLCTANRRDGNLYLIHCE